MNIIKYPFDEKLSVCQTKISELEEQLNAARQEKNTLIQKLETFYTNHLKNVYLKQADTGKIGQIESAFVKKGQVFVNLYLLEITSNSKLTKHYCNYELFGKELQGFSTISEEEYKIAFFDYVNGRIKVVEINEEN